MPFVQSIQTEIGLYQTIDAVMTLFSTGVESGYGASVTYFSVVFLRAPLEVQVKV